MYFYADKLTFFGIMVGVGFNRLAQYTADQVAVQRCQNIRSRRQARNAMIINLISDSVWGILLPLVGLALFAFYANSGGYPASLKVDRILPHFMSTHFPTGLTGLVIAAIFAASLSSVDAALNATTSIVVVDFYGRLVKGRIRPVEGLGPEEERRQVRVSRMVNVLLGIIVVLFGSNMYRFGELWQGINRILGAFGGPLFGIFVLGMFFKRAHASGALMGGLIGMAYNCYVSLVVRKLSFQWTYPVGVVVTILTGYMASRLISVVERADAPLTWRRVMSLPDRRSLELTQPRSQN
jgi:Na+/proline symporter